MTRYVYLRSGVIRLGGSMHPIDDPTGYSNESLWSRLRMLEDERDMLAEATVNAWAVLSFKSQHKGGVVKLHAGPVPALQFIEWALRSKGLLDDNGNAPRCTTALDNTARMPPLGYTHMHAEPPADMHSRLLWHMMTTTRKERELFAEAAVNGWALLVSQGLGASRFGNVVARALRARGLLDAAGKLAVPYKVEVATGVEL